MKWQIFQLRLAYLLNLIRLSNLTVNVFALALIPGGRVISDLEPAQVLKFDLRNYTYDNKVQWVAARLYQSNN